MFFKKDAFEKYYKVGRVLGKGSFAEVRMCRPRSGPNSSVKYAVKVINKGSMKAQEEEMLENEVTIMNNVNHPNVISLIQCFDCDSKFYMVLELCVGGELFDRIVKKSFYNEHEARNCIRQLFSALEHCHASGIVHRDIKPENLLYAAKEPDETVKLADFGLAALVKPDEALQSACGTPGYVAPELIKRKNYSSPVDMWSAGVVLYILLCGFPPFYDDDRPTLFKLIARGAFEFVQPYWDQVSDQAKDLVTKLLVVDPSRRLTATQALQHPWMTGDVSTTVLDGFTENMRAYNARRKFKGVILSMQVVQGLSRASAVGKASAAVISSGVAQAIEEAAAESAETAAAEPQAAAESSSPPAPAPAAEAEAEAAA